MKRIEIALRAGVALAAIVAGATSAQAQSTLPPPDVDRGATARAAAEPDAERRDRRHRIAHPPRSARSQDAPIVFVDQADIAKTGLNSINDVLQRLPSSGGGLNAKFNNSGNLGNPPDGGGVGAGAAEIDLRYLGSRRTLVLVDGLRFVNGASASGVPGSVDLNAIPESMIERVEVLQDGASAIYGSDAIAGVVNIITKKSQKGLRWLRRRSAATRSGRRMDPELPASWGNGDGPTQIVVGGNYVKANGVLSGDRAISAFPNPYSTSCMPRRLFELPAERPFRRPIFGPTLLTLAHPIIDAAELSGRLP